MTIKSLCAATSIALVSAFSPLAVNAQTIDIEITNLTQGIYFTPILVVAHDNTSHLFQVGSTASSALQAMAEGGNIADLVSATAATDVVSENPAGGLLAPALNTTITDLDTGTNGNLSIVAMMLPTNDGFIGLDSWSIPETAGTYTVYLNGYDAGTEANDEIVNGGGMSGVPGIPANPGGNGGSNASGVTATEPNQTVHIHRGNIGDTDPNGGISDVDSRIHRWLNPVAKVVITVK